MRLEKAAMLLIALGVGLAGFFTYRSLVHHVAAEERVVSLMKASGDQGSAELRAAIDDKTASLRDAIVLGDMAVLGFILLLLVSRGTSTVPYVLIGLPALAALILALPYPATPTGVAGAVAGFLTYDLAGVLLLAAGRRSPPSS